ncbi:MAG TPA: prolipoprotein diacylglyceryl transferase [Blastocatellia bacterium]|nr:prolipoprotein diacylglyceryl transferase [Blastocatellia bacterium]
MYPRLIVTPYFTLYTFGVFLAAAYLASLWRLTRSARREGLDPDRVASLGLWLIVGAFIGAKLLPVIRQWSEYAADPARLWSRSFLESAGDFYGGFLGALAVAAIYFLRNPELPFWKTADLCGPAIALGQAIGRIGCLMAGDDYGRPTRLPWAVTFTDPDAARIGGAPLNVPLHPVQLYESLACFALFGFLVWLARHKRFDGEIILAYALLYAGARFLLEYLSGDEDRGFVFGGALSTSQFIAILVGVASAILLAFRFNTARHHREAV